MLLDKAIKRYEHVDVQLGTGVFVTLFFQSRCLWQNSSCYEQIVQGTKRRTETSGP